MNDSDLIRQQGKRLIEVIVTSANEALQAESAGADRLELVRDFPKGGLTPSVRTVEETIAAVKIPVRVMVREIESFEVTSVEDEAQICATASLMSHYRIDGLVLGFTRNFEVDTNLLSKVLEHCGDSKITFHRAFEATANPVRALEALIQFPQIDKILTNGGGIANGGNAEGDTTNQAHWGSSEWSERIKRLEKWQSMAQTISILVGGEITEDVVRMLVLTKLNQFHLGRSVRTPETTSGVIDKNKISKMRELIDRST